MERPVAERIDRDPTQGLVELSPGDRWYTIGEELNGVVKPVLWYGKKPLYDVFEEAERDAQKVSKELGKRISVLSFLIASPVVERIIG